MKYFLLVLLFGMLFYSADAQETIDPGCRHYKSQLNRVKPTAEQQNYMNALAFRSDTFDIVHYAIHLEDVDYGLKTIRAYCDVYFSAKMENIDRLTLDLLNFEVDSVQFEGQNIAFDYDSLMIHIGFEQSFAVADTNVVRVYYQGHPTIDASGFGGFDFRDGYAYNLGIGLAAIPHNYGRGWFPCFDNFVERSTYDFYVTTLNTQIAYCVGHHVSTDTTDTGKKVFHYFMEKQIPTYLASVAIADYKINQLSHEGLEREIPIELVAKRQDSTKIKNSLAFLSEAIEALEQWYGPYQWERVGYVMTPVGAMEHPTSIAYPTSLGLNGNPYNNMGIMSHELAHHWWGDVTTLTTAYDMWIKEGTSEYGSHLFTKAFLGDEEFYDMIADNQFDVIENAHKNDDGFRALSGMPFEYTYGTTTYQKGAAVIHNMRSYLGDSLFKQGMQSILEKYAYSHVDAAEFETELSASTGKDMSPFFKDWIYAPGFSAFEIDSVLIGEVDGKFEVQLFIEQKLFHAPAYHENVPMQITFIDENRQKHRKIIELSGQFSHVMLSLDFKPVYQYLNENNFLNNGQLSYCQLITSPDKYKFKRSKLDVTVESISDSILLFVEHIWGAPDPILREDLAIELSSTHYWNIGGINDSNAKLSTRFYYNGKHETELDFDLTAETEDDIILLFRENAAMDWIEYPYAAKSTFIPNDSKGFFKVDSLLFGQYTFGNGDYFAVKTTNLLVENKLFISPNPGSDFIAIKIPEKNDVRKIKVIDALGRQVMVFPWHNRVASHLDISHLQNGIYFIQCMDEDGKIMVQERFIKV